MQRMWAALVAALISATLVLCLTACDGKHRWCEWDAPDPRVPNSYCPEV
ncbi:hypothetical protein [Actinomadura coerulea]